MWIKSHDRIVVGAELGLHAFIVRPGTGREPSPGVVIVHGTTGSGAGGRRWRIRLAESLADQGLVAVIFDHRGCGYSDGNFEDATVTGRIDDLHAIICAVTRGSIASERLGLFGMSLGSAVSVLHEARWHFARTAVLYSLPCNMASNYPAWFRGALGKEERRFEEWKQTRGRVFVDKAKEFFSWAFLEDLKRHDVHEAMRQLSIPLLLLQSNEDDEVAESISMSAFALATNPESRIVRFLGRHTFEGDEEKEREVIRATTAWFVERLLG